MIYDVFYFGEKPNAHPKETYAVDINDARHKATTEYFWIINEYCDYKKFDWDFDMDLLSDEDIWAAEHNNVWPSVEDKNSGTMLCPKKYSDIFVYRSDVAPLHLKLDEPVEDFLLSVNIDIFFIDKMNAKSTERYDSLKARFGDRVTKTRYVNSWNDTILRCTHKSRTAFFWVVNSELDYTDFKFDYFPIKWRRNHIHMFGTQWNHWGTTLLVNKEVFLSVSKNIQKLEHLPNLHFVKEIRATAVDCLYDVVFIDYGNKESSLVLEQLRTKTNKNIAIFEYKNSYLDTFKEILTNIISTTDNLIWVCSSICDYSRFDFSFISDPYEVDQLHVFSSNGLKYGDTFLLNTDISKLSINKLEDYPTINYRKSNITRIPEPIVSHNNDTHTSIMVNMDFPYATYTTEEVIKSKEIVNLWSSDTKQIIVNSKGASSITVPRELSEYKFTELYDYPYITKSDNLDNPNHMDIVFLSNSEKCADEHYEHLLNVTKKYPNRIVRVDGVNGRANAYHAALRASNTPWAFTVFAKLKVDEEFDWSWQPDRMQIPKHYIFYAKNPVNGLTYGHQAMIAYNKKLTLANQGMGLDFTLDDPHCVVPLLSGVAHYNVDEFTTWRTAFREVIKLLCDHSDDGKYRLNAWLTKGDGMFGEYSIKGAIDAQTYFNEVNGDFDKLKLSYEWDWLKRRFDRY